jgi:hypothetical protein
MKTMIRFTGISFFASKTTSVYTHLARSGYLDAVLMSKGCLRDRKMTRFFQSEGATF